MKKIFIILFVVLSFPVVAQKYAEIAVTAITGTDTTLYLVNGRHNLLTIDFTNVNASTSTLDVGHSDDRVSFVSASVTAVTLPVTLDKTTYTKTANGYTRNRIAFMSEDWPGTYIAVKLTKVDATAGTFRIWY